MTVLQIVPERLVIHTAAAEIFVYPIRYGGTECANYDQRCGVV
jgi:hypothetical protein